MIKYSVMDFEDVKDFQRFRIRSERNKTFIKLPRFFQIRPKYVYDYSKAKEDMAKYEMPTFADKPGIINAYKIMDNKDYESLNEYVFIPDKTECIVDYRQEVDR